MKKTYEKPYMDLISLEPQNIIATGTDIGDLEPSGGVEFPDEPD